MYSCVLVAYLLVFLTIQTRFVEGRQKKYVPDASRSENHTYVMRHDDELGCSYMAAWFLHINRFRKIAFFLDIARAEAASGEVFKSVYHRYLFGEYTNYYVHHMSMFEHVLTRQKGVEYAHQQVKVLATAARKGECSHPDIQDFGSQNMNHISIIPFFGGLPPARNASDEKGTLGQGNSVVDAFTKATQCMAAICANLRYFGHVFVGTSRQADRQLLTDMLAEESEVIRSRVTVLEFNVTKHVHQIFHLIVWTQHYLKVHNCWSYRRLNDIASHTSRKLSDDDTVPERVSRNLKSPPWWKGKLRPLYFNESAFELSDTTTAAKTDDAYEICTPGAITRSYAALTPINVTFMTPHATGQSRSSSDTVLLDGHPVRPVHSHPIRYIYYTEADQIVRFDSIRTFDVITAATNDSFYLTGYRREKHWGSDPTDYMGSLDRGRVCGRECFRIAWPSSKHIIEC